MRKRLAVCVGLNYPGTSAALNGCINDAYDWRDELLARQYEVRVLLEPTKVELVAELKGMLARVRFGDRVAFTYSGHGTWVPDRDGDEADGRDEALVCKDYTSGGLLLDDELAVLFSEVPFGVRRVILSDSCHSGTVSKFAGVDVGLPVINWRPADPGTRARFLPPANFLEGESLKAAERVQYAPAKGKPRTGPVLISGCADTEYSYDASFAGRPNGAFTRAALDALEHAKTVGGWHKAIRERLPSTHYPQSPQLTATRYQRTWIPL